MSRSGNELLCSLPEADGGPTTAGALRWRQPLPFKRPSSPRFRPHPPFPTTAICPARLRSLPCATSITTAPRPNGQRPDQHGPRHRRGRAGPSPAFSPSITARGMAEKRPLIIASITAHQKHHVLVFLPAWHEEGDLEVAPEDPHKAKGAPCSASWDNRRATSVPVAPAAPLISPSSARSCPHPPFPATITTPDRYAGPYVPYRGRLCTTTIAPRLNLAQHLKVQRASTGTTHQGAPLYPFPPAALSSPAQRRCTRSSQCETCTFVSLAHHLHRR